MRIDVPHGNTISPLSRDCEDRAAGSREIVAVGEPARSPLAGLSMVIDVVTRSCNLNCSYCHERASAAPVALDLSARLSAAEWLLSQTRRRKLQWVLHGGEPLLVDRALLTALTDGVRSAADASGVELRFGLQTNATLIDDAWARWLAERNLRVGVSLDGPPESNDFYRARGTAVERALARLSDAGVHFGILCVLTRRNVSRVAELVAYFHSLKAASLRFNPCWPVGRADAEMAPLPEDLVRAKSQLLSMVIDSGNLAFDPELVHLVRRFVAARAGVKNRPGICSTRPCGAGHSVVALTPEGAVHSCGRALALPRGLGLLAARDERPEPNLWLSRLRSFQRPQRPTGECPSCKALSICNGGCASFLWQAPVARRASCRYWRGLASVFDERLAELEALSSRLARKPSHNCGILGTIPPKPGLAPVQCSSETPAAGSSRKGGPDYDVS